MIYGFKTGPISWDEGKELVMDEGAKMCEVWFRVDKHEEYGSYLEWFKEHGLIIGLHHWAVCKSGIKNNLSTHYKEVRDETIEQMKRSIDIGSDYGCAYVNIHPGARYLEKVAFDPWSSSLVQGKPPTEASEANRLMIEGAQELNNYAREKGVTFLVETLCGAECLDHGERTVVYRPKNSSLETMKKLAANGIKIANDFTHTVTSPEYKTPPTKDVMWQVLVEFTEETKEATKLLHVNTLLPPYNGTDSHDGITENDFKKGVFPNEDQIRNILSLFKERDDVYLIPEPRQDMKQNYLALKKMVTEL